MQAGLFFGTLLQKALELVESCNCNGDSGCPGCIHHMGCGQYNSVLHKGGALLVLKATIAAEAERNGKSQNAEGGSTSAGTPS